MEKNLVVLIADDQPGMRKLLGTLAGEEGYRVYLARNGLEAVEMVRQVCPHLVFLDVKMPVMDGLEALGKIKALAPQTEVVMMTAYISAEIKRQATKKGARCCLGKPFETEEVKSILRNYSNLDI